VIGFSAPPGVAIDLVLNYDIVVIRFIERDLTVRMSGYWVHQAVGLGIDPVESAQRHIEWEERRLGRELAPGSTIAFFEGEAPGDRGWVAGPDE